jgi:hypothetical protein
MWMFGNYILNELLKNKELMIHPNNPNITLSYNICDKI